MGNVNKTSKNKMDVTSVNSAEVDICKINNNNSIELPSDIQFELLTNNSHCKRFKSIILNEMRYVYPALLRELGALNHCKPSLHYPDIDLMVNRYHNFMIASKDNPKFIWKKTLPVQIVFIWRIHLLHPLRYINDCKQHFGYLLCPKYNNISTKPYPEKSFDTQSVLNDETPTVLFTDINLKISAKKQIDFMFQITKSYRWKYCNIYKDIMLKHHINQYKLFLTTAAYESKNNKSIVPTQIIDFLWHCHMMFPVNYYYECTHFANGLLIGHNDDCQDMENNLNVNKWNFELYRNTMESCAFLVVNGYIRFEIQCISTQFPLELMDLCVRYYLVIEDEIEKEPEYSTDSYCSTMSSDNVVCKIVIP
eukprot:326240_1